MANSGFNPRARWDRHIPETEESEAHNPRNLNERIDCLAWFRSGKIQPCSFVWNNKEYKIKKVNYNWQERRGQELISYFSVNTGGDLYQISFNNATYSWRLDKIIE